MKTSFVYFLGKSFCRVICRLFYRHETIFECDPSSIPGAAIIASNHVSYLDPPLLAISWPGSLHFFAGEHLFKKKFFAAFLQSAHTHPIHKGKELGVMRTALFLLQKKTKVVIFPEGTRSKDGKLQTLRDGVAFLALQAHCPIIPCWVTGAYEAWPRGSTFPRFFGMRTKAVFGNPIYPVDEDGNLRSKQSLTQMLSSELLRLSKVFC